MFDTAPVKRQMMEWSIQQISKLAGTTSRALRHYDEIGLLRPTRVAANGYRFYDATALVRLQRILLLRQLGVGLPQIAEVLNRETSEEHALTAHLQWLRTEHERLTRQIASVSSTLDALRARQPLMAEKMFDGFDHARHEPEVSQRWGRDAWKQGDTWWRTMNRAEQSAWQLRTAQLSTDWADAARSGVAPDSSSAQALAARHVQWLTGIPGTPAATPGGDVKGYVLGLADLYVADPRFGAHYATTAGDEDGALFVRDALRHYAALHL